MLRLTLSAGALGLLGFFVGVVGTAAHRYHPYWGSVLVIALVLVAGTYARAWKAWTGLLVFSMVWIATVLLLYFVSGPGGSIVILGDSLGKAWLFGGSIAAVAPAFIPGRFVSEVPRVG